MCPDGLSEVEVSNGRAPMQPSVGRKPGLSRERLLLAVTFINANLDSNLGWKRVSRAIGMSPFHFGRNFKSTTGLTPNQYVTQCRIERATYLLASSDRSIFEVALRVGCGSQSRFTTLFRKHTGTTPGAFRASVHRR